MKVKIFLITLLTLSYLLCNSQITFQKIYGKKSSGSSSIQPTSEGGYIMAGIIENASQYDMSLVKINSTGSIIWAKNIRSDAHIYAISALQTNDNGYIACGTKKDFTKVYSIYIVKTDSYGNLEWAREYGENAPNPAIYYEASQIKQTNDGGYILSGYVFSLLGPKPACLIKINAVGDIVWTKTYCGKRGTWGYSVEQTSDGGYIMAGRINDSTSTYINNVFLIKTNSNGDTLWTKTFGGIDNIIEGYSVTQTNDRGYVLTGKLFNYTVGNEDSFLIKTDSNGILLWAKSYGGFSYQRGNYVSHTNDGGYVLAGFSDVSNSNNFFLIKTDINGDTIWTKSYGSSGSDIASCILQTSDGGYIISGTSNFNENFGTYVVKTDENGNSDCNQKHIQPTVNSINLPVSNLPITMSSGGSVVTPIVIVTDVNNYDSLLCSHINANVTFYITAFPNPFSITTTLQIGNFTKGLSLTIYNSYGQKIKEIRHLSEPTVTLYRDNLPAGMYVIHLSRSNNIASQAKLIITDN